jgi:hypothetical protein
MYVEEIPAMADFNCRPTDEAISAMAAEALQEDINPANEEDRGNYPSTAHTGLFDGTRQVPLWEKESVDDLYPQPSDVRRFQR